MKRLNLSFLLCLFLVGLVFSITSENLRVTLSNESKLLGRYLRSYSGRPIRAFTNIPYAKPPIGHLRFKAPEPIDKWDGEYKAINDGSVCTQRNPFIRSTEDVGVEDCLHLNVYTPNLYDGKKSNFPVMVYFHGGGFMCGSGIRSKSSPEHFLDHDVVLVTVNYRLGPIGFLSTEDAHCTGNFGLKDQILALEWVQQNIQQFGGDSESVTIFGGSAGGASVTYLMMSPLAQGLFSKAIAFSGTNFAPWSQPALKGVAEKRAKQLAEYFDCYTPNDWSQSIDCLRNVPARNLTAASYDFYEFDMDPMVLFKPVVEPELPGAFITKHPHEKNEISSKIPFLTGITYDEGLMKTAAYFNNASLFDDFVEKLETALPIIFYYDHQSLPAQKSITEQMIEFYFGGNLTKDKELNVTNLFSDGWFVSAMDTYLRHRLAHNEVSPTYVYLLTHKASASFSEVFLGDPDTFNGVSHADESLYLFPVREKLFSNSLPTKEDEQIREHVLQLLVNFARFGNPTPDSSNLPKWDAIDGFPVRYYRIGNLNFDNKPILGMESDGFFEKRTKFWRELDEHIHSNDEF